MKGKLTRLSLHLHPVRRVARGLLKRSGLGSYEQRLGLGAVERPFYGYIVYQAAHLADRLVYGFDTGMGLPEPMDYRDLPFAWQKGLFPMNATSLKAKLKCANLVLGDIRETAGSFFERYHLLRHPRYNDFVADQPS